MGKKRARRAGGSSSGSKGKVKPLAGWRPLTSLKEARCVTSLFHAYQNRIAALKLAQNNSKSSSCSSSRSNANGTKEKGKTVEDLEGLIESIGGRQRYQEASMLLTGKNTSSSKWVFQSVTRLGMRPGKGEASLRTLEVGAINAQIISCPFLDVRAIDLKSRLRGVEEIDFFKLECPPTKLYDVVSNAMVINCVPREADRGDMLVRCTRMLRLGGMLSLVLPRRCVEAVSKRRLRATLEGLGLSVHAQQDSPKISFWAAVKDKKCWHQAGDAIPRSTEEVNVILQAIAARKPVSQTSIEGSANFNFSIPLESLEKFCCCRKERDA